MKSQNRNGFNKKANAPLEMIIIFVVMIILGITVMVAYKFMSPINDAIQNDNMMGDVAKSIASSNTKAYTKTWDNAMVFILVLMTIFAIAFAFMIDTNPLFFFITVFLLIATIVGVALISNSTLNIVNDLGQSANFPMTFWIYEHMVVIVIILGMIIAGALYAKGTNY